MPLIERFRSVSACIEIDEVKEEFEKSLDIFSTSLKSNFLFPGFYQPKPQIEYFGKVPLNRLCGHGKTMEQIRLHTHNLSVQHFKELIDMGWRREGNNFYKACTPCCPTHALRIDVRDFKLSKNHRKILNHLADFFKYGDKSNENVKIPVKNPKKLNKQAKTEEFTLEAYIRRIFESCEAHKLEVRLVRPGSSIFRQTYEESFKLYQKYYEAIHKKQLSKSDFEESMVKTPLKTTDANYGTFHKQYLIDGRIVGVEMFDILPGYNIAQASFYDTDLMHLNMGTFMILNEMLFTQKLSESIGKQLYYCTGLYNHCFKKHHYKLQYANEILCIDSSTWIPLDKKVIESLEKSEKIDAPNSSLLAFRSKPEISSKICMFNGKVFKFETLQAEMDYETTH